MLSSLLRSGDHKRTDRDLFFFPFAREDPSSQGTSQHAKRLAGDNGLVLPHNGCLDGGTAAAEYSNEEEVELDDEGSDHETALLLPIFSAPHLGVLDAGLRRFASNS